MYEDTVVSFSHPDKNSVPDPLTEVLRAGARRLLAEAVEAKVSAFVSEPSDLVDGAGQGGRNSGALCSAMSLVPIVSEVIT